MDLSSQLDLLRSRFLPSILEIINAQASDALPPHSEIPSMIRYHLDTGGKRLRALIPLRLAEIAGREPDDLLYFSAACEVLHNATLVHDDLQDGDEFRRGRPTVWKKYGSATAINVGDAMFYLTLSIVQNDPVRDLPSVSHLFLQHTLRVIDGQERECKLQGVPLPSWEEYMTVVKGKTSALFSLPLAGAAHRLGLSENLVAQLDQAASHLGLLFQMQDDLLDIYGEKGRSQRCADVREGKLSALVIHTLHSLHQEDPPNASWLRNLLREDRDAITEPDIDRVLGLFERAGAKKHVLQLIDKQRKLAVESIALPPTPQSHRDDSSLLREFVDSLAELFCQPIAALSDRHE